MKLNNALIVYAFDCDTVDLVRKVLTDHSVKFTATKRDFLSAELFKNKELVMTVGGDGTFLKAAHFIKNDTPILGINCDVNSNEGFFMRANKTNFEEKFKKILSDSWFSLRLARLEGVIDDKKIPEPALNEFFIGSQKPYISSTYHINTGDKDEYHISSGVLVATAAGSQGWAKSGGGYFLPLESDKFQYLVREPFEGRLTGKYSCTKALLAKAQQVTITSEMKNGIVVVDSNSKEYLFPQGSVLSVRSSKLHLNVVNFMNK
jgi:NAD+ kinase